MTHTLRPWRTPCASLIALLVVLCGLGNTAHADDPVVLHHIPEGVLLESEGVAYMAYDLERFKILARLDADHEALLAKFKLLEDRLTTQTEVAEGLSDLLTEVQDALEVEEAENAQLRAALEEHDDLCWIHYLVEGALLLVVGGLIYGIVVP